MKENSSKPRTDCASDDAVSMSSAQFQPVRLSIVTTLYKSANSIEEFILAAAAAARKITNSYEIIVVDDGSPDNSLDISVKLIDREPHLRIIELSRNFGHHKAMMTGLMESRGEYCFLIDSDLEENPDLLNDFWKQLHSGDFDVVYGYQSQRCDPLLRRVGSEIAWRLVGLISSHKIPKYQCTVRLMRRPYVNGLIRHREHHTAIGGLWAITGFKQIGIPIEKNIRQRPSYSTLNRWRMMIESVTSFSEIPLIGIFYIGLIIFVISAASASVLVVQRLSGQIGQYGWASMMVSLWLIGGLILLCLGIIGLYMARIFIETKDRPYTIIRRSHGAFAKDIGSEAR